MTRPVEAQVQRPVYPARPIRLYRHALSGHCHRVELMLHLLDLPYETIDIDLVAGEHKQPAYLAINLFGQVPAIDDDGVVIADSNAILTYLATRYDASGAWLPRDALTAAKVQRWLSVAAGDVAFGPAAARIVVLFNRAVDPTAMIERAKTLLSTMETYLSTPQAGAFLAGDAPTIADVACYAYLAHAPEGNVSLAPYPAVRAWLGRVAALPRFIPMASSACGLNAA
ncbi:glutathione S-transferase family protein [Pandoraea apista]|uniref:Glutathione S-transferase n=1 Tax=Pandoraea apista TaxID=93218 RepID=A0A5E5P024_9BURK|nr:glutathione S-transferase [Pandoraea apista]AJF00929.2 glutathione S-transferase [Pandoraea apista]AKH72582.1 glutathione S-transferase [Pandoraea apista]AKI60970.1 glutathione S-transferase [Pandoraea apista]ALS65977.1 glutathione S-transferase [Pandoraea apista]AVF39152.1 glutathione S-transferase [Pandoraea apista]